MDSGVASENEKKATGGENKPVSRTCYAIPCGPVFRLFDTRGLTREAALGLWNETYFIDIQKIERDCPGETKGKKCI